MLRVVTCTLGLVLLAGCSSSGSPAPNASGPSGGNSAGGKTGGTPWVVQRLHTGSQPCATLGAAGSVWVADLTDDDVKRLDPKTGRVTGRFATAGGPCGMAYGGGAVWSEDYTGNAVTRIDVH